MFLYNKFLYWYTGFPRYNCKYTIDCNKEDKKDAGYPKIINSRTVERANSFALAILDGSKREKGLLLKREPTRRSYVLFSRKRNAGNWRRRRRRYLLRCELAAASSRRIDRAGRQQQLRRDGQRIARTEQQIAAPDLAVTFAAAIEIREISVEIQENPQGYHGRAAFRLVRQ